MFPGTRGQCERLLHRAAREGEITAIKKLVREEMIAKIKMLMKPLWFCFGFLASWTVE